MTFFAGVKRFKKHFDSYIQCFNCIHQTVIENSAIFSSLPSCVNKIYLHCCEDVDRDNKKSCARF